MTVSTMWCAVAELAASQHGAFHREQAAELQISSYRLRSAADRGELRRPLSDVFTFVSHPRTWRQRLTVLSLAGCVVSHRSAAALHRLDGFAEGKLEVSIRRSSGGRRMPDQVAVHRTHVLESPDLATVQGIHCTSVPRTLVDLAQVLPAHQVEPALDAALRGGCDLDTISSTIDRLWRPGRTGLGPLRELVRDPRRSGAVPDSLFERLVERLLLDNGLPAPVLQFEIPLGSGTRRVDLAWPACKVAVEAHSKRYHFDRSSQEDDNHRDLELAAAGWEVLYVTWKMAHNPEFFIRNVRAVLERRRSRRGFGG